MCGIMGVVLKPEQTARQLNGVRHRVKATMKAAQVRGVDAAGIMVVQPDCVEYLKGAAPASRLVRSRGFNEMMNRVTPDTVAIIGHTRLATHGHPDSNDNNHPIVDGNVIMVHNGVINNWAYLGNRYGSKAEVDSASLAAVLRSRSSGSHLNADIMADACYEAVGSIAVVAVDARNLPSVYAYRDWNPLHGITGRSGYWFASTGEILRQGGVTARYASPVRSFTGMTLTSTGPVYNGRANRQGVVQSAYWNNWLRTKSVSGYPHSYRVVGG